MWRVSRLLNSFCPELIRLSRVCNNRYASIIQWLCPSIFIPEEVNILSLKVSRKPYKVPSHAIGICSLTQQCPKSWCAFCHVSGPLLVFPTLIILSGFLPTSFTRQPAYCSLYSLTFQNFILNGTVLIHTLLFNYCSDNAILYPKIQQLPLKAI